MKIRLFTIAALAVGALLTGCAGNGNDHDSVPTLYATEYHNGVFYVGGNKGVIITSTDDGVDWTLRDSGTDSTIYKIGDPGDVFAFGEDGTVIETTDGGASWTGIFGHDISNIYGADYSSGIPITVGAGGVIQNHSDGWITENSGTTETLRSISDDDDGFYVAVGDNGTIIGSTGDGNWSSVNSGTSAQLNSVTFANGTFVVVGDNGTVLVEGKGFTAEDSGTTANLTSVTSGFGAVGQAPGFSTLVAVGDGGTIVTSTDGGLTWTSRDSTTTEDLKSVTGTNGHGFVAAGAHGTVLTSDDGFTWIERLPNAPNPVKK